MGGSDNVGMAQIEVYEGVETGASSRAVIEATSVTQRCTFGHTYCYHSSPSI